MTPRFVVIHHLIDRIVPMFRFKMFAAALIALTPLSSPGAAAAALNLTITGDFDGDFGNQSFAGRMLTFSGLTESETPDEVFDEYQYRLTSLSVKLDGTEHTVTEAAMFFIAPISQLAGIVDPDATKALVRFDYGIGNRFYTDAQTQSFATSGGSLLLRAGKNITLTDVSIAAVPEPGTWALMILGFAAIGAMQRRRGRSPCPRAVSRV